MISITCDRCYKYIRESKPNTVPDLGYRIMEKRYDFCLDCKKEFERWLMTGVRNKNSASDDK